MKKMILFKLLTTCLLFASSIFSHESTVHATKLYFPSLLSEIELEMAQNPVLLEEQPIRPSSYKSFTLSAAGDFTLGSDESFGYYGTFHHEADENGLTHFGRNVQRIFAEDDLTVVNLETTLTDATEKVDKKFRFSGKPAYVEILNMSGVEAVTLANNHTYDFLEKGYQDTIKHLNEASVSSFGYDRLFLEEVNGIKVGMIGYKGWADTQEIRNRLTKDVKALRENGAEVIIANFHWGEERVYVPNAGQQSLGKYAIDAGVDLVLGHHPHVVQGIEEYKGKFIVYSLGNFMFGGNRNPGDKDTFIFQQTFHFDEKGMMDKKDITLAPASISSVSHRNNYQPTLLTGEEATRVLEKVLLLGDDIPHNDLSIDAYTIKDNRATLAK